MLNLKLIIFNTNYLMLSFLPFTSIELWLLFGLFLILIEFTQVPGIGLVFIGFGAFTTALLMIYFPMVVDYQIITLGISSLVWLIILWHPMKSFYGTKNSSSKINFNIIGSSVQVINSDIKQNEMGQVFWSGTIMNARLGDSSASAKIGETLKVMEVNGNVLICCHKKIDL